MPRCSERACSNTACGRSFVPNSNGQRFCQEACTATGQRFGWRGNEALRDRECVTCRSRLPKHGIKYCQGSCSAGGKVTVDRSYHARKYVPCAKCRACGGAIDSKGGRVRYCLQHRPAQPAPFVPHRQCRRCGETFLVTSRNKRFCAKCPAYSSEDWHRPKVRAVACRLCGKNLLQPRVGRRLVCGPGTDCRRAHCLSYYYANRGVQPNCAWCARCVPAGSSRSAYCSEACNRDGSRWLHKQRKRFGGELPEPQLMEMLISARDLRRRLRLQKPLDTTRCSAILTT